MKKPEKSFFKRAIDEIAEQPHASAHQAMNIINYSLGIGFLSDVSLAAGVAISGIGLSYVSNSYLAQSEKDGDTNSYRNGLSSGIHFTATALTIGGVVTHSPAAQVMGMGLSFMMNCADVAGNLLMPTKPKQEIEP